MFMGAHWLENGPLLGLVLPLGRFLNMPLSVSHMFDDCMMLLLCTEARVEVRVLRDR